MVEISASLFAADFSQWKKESPYLTITEIDEGVKEYPRNNFIQEEATSGPIIFISFNQAMTIHNFKGKNSLC